MSARAVLHVGAPKTGTTYLQSVLWRNRERLREVGVLYPLQHPDEHFAAALDVREMSWGGRVDGPWLGAWRRLAGRVEAWDGSVLLSNELLGGVAPEQARTIADALAGPTGRELHVVFTARDFARQLPSDWQEHVKHRHDVPLAAFVDDLVANGLQATKPFGELFWGLHDAERVLANWSAVVPPDQLHLVVVPHAQGGPHELWQRFATASGLAEMAPGVDLDLDVRPRNVSLGVVEAELLRRLNTLSRGSVPPRHYDDQVRKVLAETVLVSQQRAVPPSQRPTLPPEHHEWVAHRSRQLVDAVTAAGYDVVGDLDDLLPAEPADSLQPDRIGTDALFPVALDALTGLLAHLGGLADDRAEERRRHEAELAAVRAERDYWRDGGMAHRLVRFSDQHAWLLPARRAYLGVRRLVRRAGSGADHHG